MSRHKLMIVPNAEGYGSHHLHLDDQDISRGVRSLNLSLNPGDFPRVELEMAVVEIDRMEFETSELYIPDATKEALIALGWAPPREIPMDRREQAREWITDFMAATDDDRVNCVALLLCAADDALACAMKHKRAEGDDEPDGTVA